MTTTSVAGTTKRQWTPFRNVGLLLRHRHDPLSVVQQIQRTAGDYVRGRFAGAKAYLISHPDAIRHVLYTNQQNYIRGEPSWSPLLRAIGNGLLFADGECHRRQRRFVQPAFLPDRIADYSKTVHDVATRMQHDWEQRAGQVIDMHQEMLRLTMTIIGKVLFDVDLSREATTLGGIISDVFKAIKDLSVSPLARFPWLPTSANRRLSQSTREFDEIIYTMIRERRRGGAQGADLLSQLLRAQDQECSFEDPLKHMSDVEVRDQVTILFGAGHETSATMLTWIWYLLSRHPEAEARLHSEINRVLGDRTPGFEDLPELSYAYKVICETLRLYPPAWINKRRVVRSDCIEGHDIEGGVPVFMSPYVVHRDPRWFQDPESFDPERFAPEEMAKRPKFSFFPFGGGHRQCIGQSFAEMEALMTIAVLAREFSPRMTTDEPALPDAVFLRPTGGLPMRIVPRTR